MSVTDEVLSANQEYSKTFSLHQLAAPPARRLAVLACMDARLSIESMLGLQTGDAHIIRNAGGIVTEDVVRSLIISQQLLGTQEVVIINHTDCGMLSFKDDELLARLERETGTAVFAPRRFDAFANLEQNVRRQIERVRSHPWIPESIGVRGFIYDVKTGRLHEVEAAEAGRLRAA